MKSESIELLGAAKAQSEQDADREETTEWLDALEAVARVAGVDRVTFLLQRLAEHASHLGVSPATHPYSLYQNTIALEDQPAYPGDLAMEERITSIIRWNALAMVAKANKAYGELGGHIASYASAAEIFEVGFNHFFHADSDSAKGDLVYFQPHSAPGVYARAFLEGRLDEEQLNRYRQEVDGGGLCSYPHPWLMPEFWQFPTGSMGIGPISSIYQARFLRYLEHRGIADTSKRHVWGVFGDGEMDEPESIAALSLAAREKLDNLTFVINCNLQRLDGPVRGNGQIIQELESTFHGRGLECDQGDLGLGLGRALCPRPQPRTAAPFRRNGGWRSTRPSARTTARITARTSSISIRSCRRWCRICRQQKSMDCAVAVTISASSMPRSMRPRNTAAARP